MIDATRSGRRRSARTVISVLLYSAFRMVGDLVSPLCYDWLGSLTHRIGWRRSCHQLETRSHRCGAVNRRRRSSSTSFRTVRWRAATLLSRVASMRSSRPRGRSDEPDLASHSIGWPQHHCRRLQQERRRNEPPQPQWARCPHPGRGR